MTNAVITINGSSPIPTVLGNRTLRIPTGGKIRAGIKILTKKAAENPKAKNIYERGVSENHSFEEIERAIHQVAPDIKTPLIPKNVAWFTVRPNDFPNPAIAGQILEAFGEDRGDGVKRLYRFPVVFPADMWQAVMPHELVAWGANDKKFWSEYSPDGRTRYCKCYAPVPMESSGKRAVRLFGGRKTMPRLENDGICNPEACSEYQNSQCNLSGRFLFFIPGIKSIDAFELHTNSFYAMSKAIEQFETLAFMRGGRISGFLDDRKTPFYLTKKLREVPYIDEQGRAVRTEHWIIELEAPIDITALLQVGNTESAVLNAAEAVRVLEGGNTAGREESIKPAVFDLAVCNTKRDSSCPDVEQVIAAADAFGIEAAHYEEYAAKRWGPGWKLNANGRRRALEEIERYKNDPEGLIDKIDVELRVCS
jgi:hypothetical protein